MAGMTVHPGVIDVDGEVNGVGTVEYLPVQVNIPPGGRRPVLGWGLAVLPPMVAVLCWPAFFAIFFVMSFTLALMAVTGCLIWAWRVSDRQAIRLHSSLATRHSPLQSASSFKRCLAMTMR